MFWPCFSYDYKELCNCWKSETAKEKKRTKDQIKDLNKRLELATRQKWELTKNTSCLRLRNISGRKLVWKFTEAIGAYVQKNSPKNIDWWRYQIIILKPLLILFTKNVI